MLETGKDDESHVDLLNHCAICLTHFDSENSKSGRVILEGVSLKHLWIYFLETNGEDGGSGGNVQTWTFVNPMKNEVTTIPPLCLECSEIILELNKRHQDYMETWRLFQAQIKLLHSLLVEEENMQRYRKFQETLVRSEKLGFWKQKTRKFLEGIRRKVQETDDAGILSESAGDHLDSCDEEEVKEFAMEVKEESLDDVIIEDGQCEAGVEYTTGASDATDAACDNESTCMDDEMNTQIEAGCYYGPADDNNDDEDSDYNDDIYIYDQSSDNIDSSSDNGDEEELISVNTSGSKNTVVKRSIIEDEDPLAEISTPSSSKKFKIIFAQEASLASPLLLSSSEKASLPKPSFPPPSEPREVPPVRNCIPLVLRKPTQKQPIPPVMSNTVDGNYCINAPRQELRSTSSSRRKNPVVKRNIIENEDEGALVEISAHSSSQPPLVEISAHSSSQPPLVEPRRKVDANKCHLCNFKITPTNKKRHYATRHRKHPYNCDICGDNIYPEEFSSHLEAHVGDYITKCTNPSCSYVAINPKRLWKLHLSRRNEDCTDAGRKYSEFCAKSYKKCEYCNITPPKGKSCVSLHSHVINSHEPKSVVKALPCPVETCDKKFAYRESVQLHLSDHALSALIFEEQPCSVCYQLYMPPAILTSHLKGFHKFSEIIKCEHCPYIFGTRKYLLDHMCEFHVKTMEGVRCDICKDKDPTRYTTLCHIRAHYSQAHQIGEPLVCDKCGFSTFSQVNFQLHERDHDKYKLSMPKELIKCDLCKEKFLSDLKKWMHMRDIHNDERPRPVKEKKKRQYPCKHCDQIFDDKKVKARHCKSAHPKTHVCESCGKSFKSSGGLYIHQKLHEGERPFVCEVCSHAFAQQGDLNSHMRIHTGERPYKCSICSESFRQRTGLRKHSLAVHKVDKTYVCSRDPSCGKSFTTYKELAHHEIREHENVCHLCTEERKEFETRKELQFHMRLRHRDTFSFKCEQCETLCVSEAGLELHRIHKHKH